MDKAVSQKTIADNVSVEKKKTNFFDYSLLFIVLFVTGFGLVMMYSASGYTAQNRLSDALYFFKRQALFAAIGVLVMLVTSFFNYHNYGKLVMLFYAIAVALTILTFVIGQASHGSARWIAIAGIRFQPSELVKIAVILAVAVQVTHYGARLKTFKQEASVFLWGLFPAVIIAKTNLSTAIIIMGITFFMLFIGTRNYRGFLFLGILGILAYIFAFPFARFISAVGLLHDYQLRRIFAWKNPMDYPDDTFQTLQGLYAIGSGGLFGKGLGGSTQKLGFVPEASNDMIFTILCEELGLFGAFALILLYVFMLYRMLRIATQAEDAFSSLVTIGVMTHVAFQVFFHIAVVTNLLPNTGISLPFISYGGTSSIFLMAEIGLVINVGRGRREKRLR